jgi:hypothetical protein
MFLPDWPAALSDAECRARLAGMSFGRVAITLRALPIVVPVSYAYLVGSVILGMDEGPACDAAGSGSVITLAVDDGVPGKFWSVLIIGCASVLTDDVQRIECERIGLLGPSGGRTPKYVQLQPDIITGYRSNVATNDHMP